MVIGGVLVLVTAAGFEFEWSWLFLAGMVLFMAWVGFMLLSPDSTYRTDRPLGDGHPAVDGEGLAGDVAGGVGGEEDHRGRELGGVALAAGEDRASCIRSR